MSISYIFTARKRSLGQGNMFTGVCLSTGGGLVLGGCLVTRGSGPRGVAAPQRACLVLGGLPGPGGSGPRGVPGPRGCAWWRPPIHTATAVGGNHPTGMHSCYIYGDRKLLGRHRGFFYHEYIHILTCFTYKLAVIKMTLLYLSLAF